MKCKKEARMLFIFSKPYRKTLVRGCPVQSDNESENEGNDLFSHTPPSSWPE